MNIEKFLAQFSGCAYCNKKLWPDSLCDRCKISLRMAVITKKRKENK